MAKSRKSPHRIKPHAKVRKHGKCPNCGRWHDRSAHWSHEANDGAHSYKHSRSRPRRARKGRSAASHAAPPRARKALRRAGKPRRTAAQIAATKRLVAMNRRRRGR